MSTVLAAAPALPLHTAGKYVAGAYIVFVALILVYVVIMATRLGRNERELAELRRDLEAARAGDRAGENSKAGENDESDRQTEPVA